MGCRKKIRIRNIEFFQNGSNKHAVIQELDGSLPLLDLNGKDPDETRWGYQIGLTHSGRSFLGLFTS